MSAWGVEPDHLSYNTIMDAFARAGNVVNVEKIFNFMLVRGFPRVGSRPAFLGFSKCCTSWAFSLLSGGGREGLAVSLCHRFGEVLDPSGVKEIEAL